MKLGVSLNEIRYCQRCRSIECYCDKSVHKENLDSGIGFEVGDTVRLTSDEYRYEGKYGKHVRDITPIEKGTVLHPDCEFKKNELFTVYGGDRKLIFIKKITPPFWTMAVKNEDLERT